MKIVADEDVESIIVHWLREQQHDVVWMAECAPASSDHQVLRLAQDQQRIVITADLDFGDMVVRKRLAASGVILLRYRVQQPQQRMNLFRTQWLAIAPRAVGNFIVVTDGRMRVRRIE